MSVEVHKRHLVEINIVDIQSFVTANTGNKHCGHPKLCDSKHTPTITQCVILNRSSVTQHELINI